MFDHLIVQISLVIVQRLRLIHLLHSRLLFRGGVVVMAVVMLVVLEEKRKHIRTTVND